MEKESGGEEAGRKGKSIILTLRLFHGWTHGPIGIAVWEQATDMTLAPKQYSSMKLGINNRLFGI